MRKLVILLVSLLLAGCGLVPTPTPSPTPRPTVTPTQAPRYYPTVDPQTSQEIRYRVQEPKDYYHESLAPDGTIIKFFSLMVISSGKTGVMQAGDFVLDVLWVYERNRIATQYPLIIAVQEGKTYTPYYVGYSGDIDRQTYLEYLEQNGILDRGRKIFPSVSGDFVNRSGIDWQACGDSTFCRLGQYLQETYDLDYRLINRVMGWNAIPEGWALAWMWDAATEENSDPQFMKINLP
ncbi:hypothetical protein [Anaerolinea sp.]|uniref:hypothetical protein n=1 Tax=Anaerolinea sp. TaxID=1872519 RepID=UPI002ACEBE69|nr:hypothetical protein [Anaerolinea sp.]